MGKASIPRSKTHIPKDEPMPYETMSVEEIKALKVAELTDENCELYLWTTQKYLPDAFEVLKAWGFKYGKDNLAVSLQERFLYLGCTSC